MYLELVEGAFFPYYERISPADIRSPIMYPAQMRPPIEIRAVSIYGILYILPQGDVEPGLRVDIPAADTAVDTFPMKTIIHIYEIGMRN